MALLDSELKRVTAVIAFCATLATLTGAMLGAYRNVIEREQARAVESERLQQMLCRLRTHVRVLENIETSEHPAYTPLITWDVDPCDLKNR